MVAATKLILSLLVVVTSLSPCVGWTAGGTLSSYRHQSTRIWSTSSSSSIDHKYFSFLATCIPGLADVLAEELRDIHSDILDIQTSGSAAVSFTATREASLHALLETRVAHRLLEQIVTTEDFGNGNRCVLYDRDDLYSFVYDQANAKSWLFDKRGRPLSMSVKAILNNGPSAPKDLCHTHYSAMTVKRALCDSVGEIEIPVDLDDPDVPLVCIFCGNPIDFNGGDELSATFTLYRSLHSPGSLHKRGYRGDAEDNDSSPIHRAAMKESLAAGLLYHSGWHRQFSQNKDKPLTCVDPMAGSGTLLLEAALMASDMAPGLMRIKCASSDGYRRRLHQLPPVVRWSDDVDALSIWKNILANAVTRAKTGLTRLRSSNVRFLANDAHPGAVGLLEDSLVRAGLTSLVSVTCGECRDLKLLDDVEILVVTNPPWGVRLGGNDHDGDDDVDVEESWDSLRYFLRDTCPSETTAWVLIGGGGNDENDIKPGQLHKIASSRLRMKREGGDSMLSLRTGSQHLRWIQYKIGSSSKVREPRSRSRSTMNQEW